MLDKAPDLDPQVVARIEKNMRDDLKREEKAMLESPLNAAQEQFCRTFVDSGGDLDQAWIAAGYSRNGKHWKRDAQRMLGRPHIFRRVAYLRGQARLGEDVDVDWVKMKAASVVNRCLALNQYKEANTALRLLAEHLRMLPDGTKSGNTANINLLGLLTGDDNADRERLQKSAKAKVIDVEDQNV